MILESVSEEQIRELLRDSRTTSRSSSRSSNPELNGHLTNGICDSDISYRNKRDPERQPFLPEINPNGSLISAQRQNNMTQRLNNQSSPSPPSSAGRSTNMMLRNSLSDSQHGQVAVNQEPRPPSSGRSSANSGKYRTLSPIVRNDLHQ